jgi:hypothetical protein
MCIFLHYPPWTIVTIFTVSPDFTIFLSWGNNEESAPFIVTMILSASKFLESITFCLKNPRISDTDAQCLSRTRFGLPAAFLIPPKSFMSINSYFHRSSTSSDSVISSPSEVTAISFSTACRCR